MGVVIRPHEQLHENRLGDGQGLPLGNELGQAEVDRTSRPAQELDPGGAVHEDGRVQGYRSFSEADPASGRTTGG